jgi:hypothetical protein
MMSKANYANYEALDKFLADNEIEYEKLSPHQYRILGDAAIVDVWPARMTVHIIQTESVDPNRYFKLDYYFNGEQLQKVLEGGDVEL